MSIDPNDFLLSGGVPAAKFPTVGSTVKGTVVSSEVTQQSDYATGAKKFYDNGDPMMQVVITLQTDQHDSDIADDTGLRKLYVKGQMTAALREALRASGARLEVGGTLAVQYVEDKPSEKRGFNPTKVYRAQYQPAAAGAVNDLLGAPSAQAPAAAPAAAGVAPGDLL